MKRLTYSGTKEAKPDATIKEVVEKLTEYEDLEEQGKLLKLPCAVGDVVYRLYTVDGVIKVYDHRITTLTNIVNIMETGEIGKTVFLTKEAAESALRDYEEIVRRIRT